ncbi:lysophospholipid acyltransferase family protein [Planctobacterium marinum]|uniref:L-ornithine N(alpha)-acyltransferase n=1 Tax=Planctobacterium marinum TaxID=1631968 RepID=A0AA48KR28_9ALTE|nr:acyltransferase [Planctobacterium marinum]
MFSVHEVLSKQLPSLAQKPLLFKPLKFLLKRLMHEREFVEFGEKYPHLQGIEFIEQALEYFNFTYSTRDSEKERIPASGPLVIVANHPIGSLDGLALIKMVSEVRPDVKAVVNEMLMAVKPLNELLLPVNVMSGNTAKQDIARIQEHLKNQGAIIVFPAGEVSRLRPQGIRDTKWNTGFVRIAKTAKAAVLPVFIEGKNSALFYGVSMLYKPLATMLLVDEMFKQKNKHLPMRIGQLIPYESYGEARFNNKLLTKLFKKHLYRIASNKSEIFATQKSIAAPENRQILTRAIKKDCELLGSTTDDKEIYLYRYNGSSPILREIGRLREIAFRAVGEGSNKRRDTDQYDNDYFHLILWDKDDLEIVGAYRFGDAQRLKQEKGLKGLYSASLFKYNKSMDPYFRQGLELGRSFVQPKYWGKRSLDYLWYGIGAFLTRYPQYRYLFGPVSLSNSFPQAAKDLMVEFYQLHFGTEQEIAVSNYPYRLPEALQGSFTGDDYKADFITLKNLLANMGVAIPTLYKQYTELCEPGGTQFLGFGVDPDFNDCVDGLILVDLMKLKAKKRQRYLPETIITEQSDVQQTNPSTYPEGNVVRISVK